MAMFSVDMKVCATLYIRADSAKAAKEKAQKWADSGLEVSGIEISDAAFSEAPDESFSPAMTVHGVWPRCRPERVE